MKTILLTIILCVAMTAYAQQSVTYLDKFSNEVGTVSLKKYTYVQTFASQDGNEPCLVRLNVEEQEKGDQETWEWNMADINEHRVSFETRRDEVFLELHTLGNKSLIKYIEDGEVKGYKDELIIRAEGLEVVRTWLDDMKIYVEGCKTRMESQTVMDPDASLEEVSSFLSENIGTIRLNENRFEQRFKTEALPSVTYEVTDSEEGDLFSYTFNVRDLNSASVGFDTRREDILVEVKTTGNRKLIQSSENGELGNYESKLEIRAEDIETARLISQAMRRMIDLVQAQPNEDTKQVEGLSLTGIIDLLQEKITNVTVNEDTYKQSLEVNDELESLVTFNFQDLGKDDQYQYNFNLADLNLGTVSFNTRGKEVMINLETRLEKDMIQELKNGTPSGYEKKLDIKATSIDEARSTIVAIKKAIELSSEQSPNPFNRMYPDPNQEQARSYCQEQIQKVVIGEDAYEQSVSFDAENPCLTTLTVQDLSKGDEYEYVFNMADMNAYNIDFESSSNKLKVVMEARGGKDLIQIKENGEVDGFKDDFSFYASNIEQAKGLVIALRFLAEACNP